MAFCTECGNPLQDGAKFCFQCGTPVSAAPAGPSENNGLSENPILTDENFGYVQQSPSDGYIQNQTIEKKSQQSSATKQENIKNVWTKPADGDQQLAMSPLVDAETTPEQILPDTYEEDDDDYDFSQNDFDRDNPTREEQPDLSKLSTANNVPTPPTAVDTLVDVSVERDPTTDPFYDSVMPEIENEIYKLPKDIFVKGILLIVAIVVIIFWLLFVLS